MIDLSWAANFLPLTGAGFGVGFLVGLTGVGGGALMTPLLISTFGVSPQIAVGTDLLYASITKTAGSWRHHVSDHVEWPIVFRLAAGSIPAAIILLVAMAYHPAQHRGACPLDSPGPRRRAAAERPCHRALSFAGARRPERAADGRTRRPNAGDGACSASPWGCS